MKWVHWTTQENLSIHDIRPASVGIVARKPVGAFWLSDESDEKCCWSHLCTDWYSWAYDFPYGYEVVLYDKADLFYVAEMEDLDYFVEEYCSRMVITLKWDFVNWDRVREDYQGVIFSPFLLEGARKYDWYNSVEISCAAILDPMALYSISENAIRLGA